MGVIYVSQTTGKSTVCSTICLIRWLRKKWKIRVTTVDMPHKRPVMRSEFSCHEVIKKIGSRYIWPCKFIFDSPDGRIEKQLTPPVVNCDCHYNVVIMRAMASQITSLTIVYSTVYSMCRSKKTPKLRVTALCEGNSPVTVEFPAQRASDDENVSIWWRHHELRIDML